MQGDRGGVTVDSRRNARPRRAALFLLCFFSFFLWGSGASAGGGRARETAGSRAPRRRSDALEHFAEVLVARLHRADAAGPLLDRRRVHLERRRRRHDVVRLSRVERARRVVRRLLRGDELRARTARTRGARGGRAPRNRTNEIGRGTAQNDRQVVRGSRSPGRRRRREQKKERVRRKKEKSSRSPGSAFLKESKAAEREREEREGKEGQRGGGCFWLFEKKSLQLTVTPSN